MGVMRNLDVFRRYSSDIAVPTTHGGILSILSAVFMGYLLVTETHLWLSTQTDTDMVVWGSKDQLHDIRIELNLTTVEVPCGLVKVQVMDIQGNTVTDTHDTIHLFRKPKGAPRGEQYESRGEPTYEEIGQFKQDEEGCIIEGFVDVARVPGMLQIGVNGNTEHIHARYPQGLRMNHLITSFGFANPSGQHPVKPSLRPLDDHPEAEEDSGLSFQYHLDVVPVIEGPREAREITHFDMVVLSNSHRSHNLPAIWFNYLINPVAIRRTPHHKSFSNFLTHVCAIVGGVFVIIGLLNSIVSSLKSAIMRNVVGDPQ
eukprot:NODE_4057_length_1121_cov_144.915832_g3863_i0.p1 GENE.NODE_4057_length_1121_cov_144.915832_g3863_i0~~NODE_4057_length_1121_cov_144.915832_g3863_i0.p1  ORF type:complete len:314 (-),score=26.32 NODE_4057_length_1121_cov_144.915832_g3863_i0:112-1053(-)